MKLTRPLQPWLLSLGAGLALIGSATVSSAQVTLPLTYTFDHSANSWQALWWGSGSNVHWDGTRDAATNANSGSVRCEAPLNGDWGGCWGCVEDGWGWDQNIVIDNTSGAAGLLSCDILIDPSTAPTTSGDYGTFNFGLEDNVTWTLTAIGSVTLPLSAATNWTHVSIPIAAGKPAHFFGYVVSVWPGNFTNSIKFNIDNLVLGQPLHVTLTNPSALSSGGFQFSAANLTPKSWYAVRISSDLQTWTDLDYIYPDTTSYTYVDTSATGAAARYYRLVLQQ